MDQKRKEVGGKFNIHGKIFTIYGGVNPIGRNKEAVVNIKSLGVSQQHAVLILVDDDLHFISDLKSSNGTFLDNKKLDPLQLYRLENGSRIKFADIEGTYSKCTSNDVERQENSSILSENTQNFTQNFYGSDTQIMDNSKTLDLRNNISTQELVEVAEKLESSYIEAHEKPTQLVNSKVDKIPSILEEKEDTVPSTNEQLIVENFASYEAETQVIVIEMEINGEGSVSISNNKIEASHNSVLDHHEAETQVIDHEINESTGVHNGRAEETLHDLREVESHIVDREVETVVSLNNEGKESHEQENVNISNNEENKGSGDNSAALTSDIKTQDDYVVIPLGLSSNVVNDTQNSLNGFETSLDDSESDIIRPLKKSVNIFESQDSTYEDLREDTRKSETNNCESDSESDIIRPLKKSINTFESQDSGELEEGSNDSVDFMTMQRIPTTQKLFDSEVDSSNNKIYDCKEQIGENNRNILKNDGSETDIEEGSETENEMVNKPPKNKSIADSEADSDGVMNTRTKKKSLRKKKRNTNIISDSDSETDIEPEKAKKIQVKKVSVRSVSETDIENNESGIDCRKNKENNKSVGLILEESALEDDLKNSEKEFVVKQNTSIACNELLNDSDFIPSTQEENPKSTSQNSKFENSENSFKLGLTQLMEEDDTSQPNEPSSSQNVSEIIEEPENSQKKFTFKKSSLGITKSGDITLDCNEDIYLAKTQNMCEESSSKVDEHVFLQPTQEAPKRTKKSKDDDEIYMLSTQKLDGSTNKNTVEDFYQQSTQKLIIDEFELGKNELRLSGNEFYHLPTQKLTEYKNPDDEDIFATQVMNLKDSPSKCLESELENMFATQRAIPAEDSLDRIQDIVDKKEIIDDKLPKEDKDLEAILATQKMLASPKTSRKNDVEEAIRLGKSVESQLEVIFASQTSSLPPDKFVRPANPLVDIFAQDTQDTQELLKKNWPPEKEKPTNVNESIKSRKTSHVGLEQSFALLEAESLKIRRSGRSKNFEDITVSCPKSRVSMVVAPNVKESSEDEAKTTKNVRNTRKRKASTVLENSRTNVKGAKQRRRIGETSDEENEQTVSRNTRNKLLTEVQDDENIKPLERPKTPSRSRSSRIQKKVTEEIIESTNKNLDTNEQKSYRTRTKTCDSSDNVKEKEVMKNEGRATNKSSKPKNSETADTNKEKAIDTENQKTSRTRTSKISYPDSGEDNSEVNSRNKSRRVLYNEESFDNEDDDKRPMNAKNLKKFKDNLDKPETPSRTSKRGSTIQVTTPPKIKKVSVATPSRSKRGIDLQDTPNRTKRKLKPKVVFTMMESPQLESQIKQLGGSVVDSVDTCTVLITKFVKRTMKLLSAVGLGKPICTEAWVLQSRKENNFLDPWDFVLADREAEKKWDFSLKTSLERSSQTKLFEGYTFQLLVTSAQDVLKGAIESCGGKIVARTPKVVNNFVVVSSPDQKDKYKKLLKQSNLIIVESEAIFDAVLRQEIRFERHLLK